MATIVSAYEVSQPSPSGAVILLDAATGDEIAEVFHCEMHAVAQVPEEAVYTAKLFAAAAPMLSALLGLLAVRPVNHDDDDDPEQRAAWRAASEAIALAGAPAR